MSVTKRLASLREKLTATTQAVESLDTVVSNGLESVKTDAEKLTAFQEGLAKAKLEAEALVRSKEQSENERKQREAERLQQKTEWLNANRDELKALAKAVLNPVIGGDVWGKFCATLEDQLGRDSKASDRNPNPVSNEVFYATLKQEAVYDTVCSFHTAQYHARKPYYELAAAGVQLGIAQEDIPSMKLVEAASVMKDCFLGRPIITIGDIDQELDFHLRIEQQVECGLIKPAQVGKLLRKGKLAGAGSAGKGRNVDLKALKAKQGTVRNPATEYKGFRVEGDIKTRRALTPEELKKFSARLTHAGLQLDAMRKAGVTLQITERVEYRVGGEKRYPTPVDLFNTLKGLVEPCQKDTTKVVTPVVMDIQFKVLIAWLDKNYQAPKKA
jgi:hypothetical protein